MPSGSAQTTPFVRHPEADFWWLVDVDLEPIADVLSDERVTRFMDPAARGSLETQRRAAARHRIGQSLQLAIVRRDGEPLGG